MNLPEPLKSVVIGFSAGTCIILTFFTQSLFWNIVGVLLGLGFLFKLTRPY